MAIFPGSAIPSAVSDYEIDNSVRGDGTGYLERTPAVDGNRRTWTFSAWVKISGNDESMFGTPAGYPYMQWKFDAGSIEWMEYTGSYTFRLVTTQVFRDPSAWYHFVASVDTTQATASNRLKMYVNGEQITDFSTETYPAQDTELCWSKSGEAQRVLTGNTDPFEGYMAEVYSIDGTALTPSTFGELDSDTNQWKPLDSDDVKDAVTFGTNGFYQKYNSTELAASFADSSNSSRYITGNRRSEITVSTDMSIYQGDNGDGSLNHQVDGSTANSNPRWYPNGETAAGKYLRYDFGSGNTVTITEAKWYQDTTATQGVWKWQGSDDASSWTDIGSSFTLGNGATGTSTPQVQTELNGNTTAYRYYQLLGISGSVVNLAYYLEIIFKQNLSHTITANGDATNQRPQPHTVTANGHAHLIGPKVGTSVIHFAGGGQYLSMPDSSDWQLGGGTGDFTVECWMNPLTPATEFKYFGQRADDSNRWYLSLYQEKVLFYAVSGGSTVGDFAETTAGSIKANTWSHVAFVRSGSTAYLFVNGVSQPLTTNTAFGTQGDISAVMCVGRFDTTSDTQDFVGSMGPVRISNSARYTADFDVPTTVWTNDGNTKLLIQNGTDGSQTFDDLSTGDHTITANGSVRWFAPKVGAGAMAFDGTGDYLACGSSDDWDIGDGDFTMECWIKFNTLPTTGLGSEPRFMTSSNDSWFFRIAYVGSNHRLEFGTPTTDPFTAFYGTVTSFSTNQWYHVAVSRTGSGDTNLKLFVDGVDQSASEQAGSWDYDISTSNLFIGGDASAASTGRLLDGYIDGVRISRTARYTSGGFTLPTTAFTDDINTALILNADVNQGTWNQDTSTGLAISTDSRMYFDGTGDYLSIPDSSDWDLTGDFTIEFWFNLLRTTGDPEGFIMSGDDNWKLWLQSVGGNPKLHWEDDEGYINASTTVLEAGQWYHTAIVRSGTTITMYIDGASEGTRTTTGTISGTTLEIGRGIYSGTNYYIKGYMDEIRISDSARYTGTFTPQTRGNPFTADANTKLLIHSDYTGGLGADSSGNYNAFTPTNLAATDQMIDTPTNSFCTINPLATYPGAGTFSEGNLKFAGQTGQSGADRNTRWDSTMSVDSGKWYFEALAGVSSDSTQSWVFGIRELGFSMRRQGWGSGTWTAATDGYMYGVQDGDQKQEGGSTSSFTNGIVTGDVVSLLLDLDSSPTTLKCWVNGSDKGTLFSSLAAKSYGPAGVCWQSSNASTVVLNTGSDSSFAGNKTAQGNQDSNGKGDFYYEPPSGFLALCSENLPVPEIKLPGEHSNPVIYTGNATARSITGVGFAPDFTWIKQRSGTEEHQLQDSVRGPTKTLVSNTTAVESTSAAKLTSFDSDGFSLGTASDVNGNTSTYVAWNWKAGGAPTADNSAGAGATPTAGSVKIDGSNLGSALAGSIPAIRLSANTTSGFSIVTYEGTEAAATVAHGLSQAPELILFKNIDSSLFWPVYNKIIDATDYLILDTTAARADSDGYFNDTEPTSTVFSLGDKTNLNRDTCIAYCFHSVEGYSKVGSYVANENADGPFIYTGFRPALVLIKNVDNGSHGWFWYDNKRDTYNAEQSRLMPNVSTEELYTNPTLDFVSNGFKLRTASTFVNDDTETNLYMAFAESPFKYSNAR